MPKKVLCHHAEVAKNFRCSTRLCFLQCDWRREISLRKIMKPEESARCHQTLSRRWGLGTRLAGPPTHLCFYHVCAAPRLFVARCGADTGSMRWRIVQSQRSNCHLKEKVGSLRNNCVYRIYFRKTVRVSLSCLAHGLHMRRARGGVSRNPT